MKYITGAAIIRLKLPDGEQWEVSGEGYSTDGRIHGDAGNRKGIRQRASTGWSVPACFATTPASALTRTGAPHIGVAMVRGGTDVARRAASLVLTDDNFASLVDGIEQGLAAFVLFSCCSRACA